jgi:phospholipase/carboxylesterase
MTKVRRQRFGGLEVVVLGGTDGLGGGQGPLCVLLHGFGASGTDLVPLGRMLGGPPGMRFAFPAAPLALDDGSQSGSDGYFGPSESRAWWLIDMERLQRALMSGRMDDFVRDEPVGLTAAREQLVLCLAELERELAVPAGQLVLGGFSQGAMLSLDVALRTGLTLGGVILWSATILAEPQWQKLMPARRGLRIFQSHGRQDPLLPFSVASSLRHQLSAAGLAVDWHEFTGGHEIPLAVLQATSAFLGPLVAG